MLLFVARTSELDHTGARVSALWLARALPLAEVSHSNRFPAHVIAVQHSDIHVRRRCVLVALALSIVTGCKGDADGKAPRRAEASPATSSHESAGDIVIQKPVTAYTVASSPASGSVTGTVTLKGTLEPLPPAATGNDASVCGPSIPDESVQVLGGGLAGTVVWLEGVRSGKAIALERRVELESDRCRLSPRVQAAVVGSAVNIIGHDDFRQHLRFVAGGETTPRATILLSRGEQVIPTELPFTSPGLVVVRDTDHPWVRASLAVFDHPYFAVTGAGGAFTIDGVPAGTYTLHGWHERTGLIQQRVDVSGGATKVSLALEGKQ